MSKVIYADIDVMVNNGHTFYKTLHYPYCPLFKLSIEEIWQWITDKLPSLLTRNDAKCYVKIQDGMELEIKRNK